LKSPDRFGPVKLSPKKLHDKSFKTKKEVSDGIEVGTRFAHEVSLSSHQNNQDRGGARVDIAELNVVNLRNVPLADPPGQDLLEALLPQPEPVVGRVGKSLMSNRLKAKPWTWATCPCDRNRSAIPR
jgi:hypothetical protein